MRLRSNSAVTIRGRSTNYSAAPLHPVSISRGGIPGVSARTHRLMSARTKRVRVLGVRQGHRAPRENADRV